MEFENRSKSRPGPGPNPERLRVEGPWDKAVAQALKKPGRKSGKPKKRKK